jgi:transposase
VTPRRKLVGQRLDISTRPNQLHLEIATQRGALFPCPVCCKARKAHDFAEFTWRHLDFFQHHCYVTANVPRTDCPDYGVLRIKVPWARQGKRITTRTAVWVGRVVRAAGIALPPAMSGPT